MRQRAGGMITLLLFVVFAHLVLPYHSPGLTSSEPLVTVAAAEGPVVSVAEPAPHTEHHEGGAGDNAVRGARAHVATAVARAEIWSGSVVRSGALLPRCPATLPGPRGRSAAHHGSAPSADPVTEADLQTFRC
ncbi:hypothetical protein ACTVZO_05950 [Streptomyces sp. IBSNAI002]|uniref:hypothetical protein n=1 Tax=Streptomyces sp. IBSNAI002 TaxID=3457500 RepID=UPI003FD615D3